MKRTFTRGALSLLLALAACTDERLPIEPDPGKNDPRCAASPSQISAAGNIPVLGLGCIPGRYTSEVWVQNGWGYTGTWSRRGANLGNVLYVWNVSGNTPALRDSVVVADASTLGDVQVTDDGKHLVVSTEGGQGSIVVYELTDPAKPRQVARHSSANTQAGVHTAEVARVNGKLYAFLSVPGRAQVVVVDLSNPSAPREVVTRVTGAPFTHDVFVRDGLLFTAGWNAGTTVWDIGGGGRGGTPGNPVQMTTFTTVGGKVHNVWWFHDPSTGSKRYLFIGEEGPTSLGSASSGDIHVVDFSNPSAPREVAFYTLAGAGTHNFAVDEAKGFLYAAYYNGGVRALDIRGDLGTCTAAQKDAQGRCDLVRMGREVGRALVSTASAQTSVWGVHLVGNHLYASDMLNGLWKLDVSGVKR